mmetsp:Transcript_6600/g.15798  ORF Transcript_6600/g.15798 Transcript_6600/m.15798 type:complete len:262 (+) Transcript_6600:844-1629(+)
MVSAVSLLWGSCCCCFDHRIEAPPGPKANTQTTQSITRYTSSSLRNLVERLEGGIQEPINGSLVVLCRICQGWFRQCRRYCCRCQQAVFAEHEVQGKASRRAEAFDRGIAQIVPEAEALRQSTAEQQQLLLLLLRASNTGCRGLWCRLRIILLDPAEDVFHRQPTRWRIVVVTTTTTTTRVLGRGFRLGLVRHSAILVRTAFSVADETVVVVVVVVIVIVVVVVVVVIVVFSFSFVFSVLIFSAFLEPAPSNVVFVYLHCV